MDKDQNPEQPPERTGPSDETLKAFLPQLKKFIEAHPVEGRIHRPKGTPVVGKKQHAWPRFTCPICRSVSISELNPVGIEKMPEDRDCDECRVYLEQGMIAIIAPDGRYSFVFSAPLASRLEKERLDAAKDGRAIPPLDRVIVSNADYDVIAEHVKQNREKQQSPKIDE